jgi:hypothetical protein
MKGKLLAVTALFAICATMLPGCGGGYGGGNGGNSTGPNGQAGAPATLVIYAGDGQTGTRGNIVDAPLCTNVLDAAGHRLYGIRVTYTVATGGGSISPPTEPVTDNSGIATSGLWTLGQLAGDQTVTASSAGVASVTFTAHAN